MPGTGQFVAPVTTATAKLEAPPASGGVQLQFNNADIAEVIASVLGEGLGLTFSIDPAVKGSMTLRSSRPLANEEVLPALEAALRVQDLALVHTNGVYQVVPLKDAPRRAGAVTTHPLHPEPGFAIEVVSLEFTSVAEMEKILQPFAPTGGVLRVDEARNLLLLAGTRNELDTMLGVIKTFDVDWLAGMSYALDTLSYVDARTAVTELSEIFADPKSPLVGVVRLIPMPRLNAILVITPQAKYLSTVETWIRRIDVGGSGPGRRIYVYDVQNGRAEELAHSLERILSIETDDYDTRSSSRRSSAPSFGSSGFGATNGAAAPADTSSSSASPMTSTYGAARPGYATPGYTGAGRGLSSTSANTGPLNTLENGDVRIVPDLDSNSLLILANPSEYAVIESALRRLDRPSRQVLIEASVAEVTLTNDLRFGIQWSYASKNGPVTLSPNASGKITQTFPGLSYLYSGALDIQAALHALESITKVKVISSPKIVTLNNHEAELQVGDQVPIATASAVSVSAGGAPIVNSVELHDTGVILKVTPRVNQNGLVQLDISQEVSAVAPTTTSGIDSPTIQERRLASTVEVRSGDTIALGGLIEEDTTRSKSGVPILGRVPLLGALFRETGDNTVRKELVLLITPRVMRDEAEFAAVMDDLRGQFKTLQPAFEKPPKSN